MYINFVRNRFLFKSFRQFHGIKYPTFNGRFNKVRIMTCGFSRVTARTIFMLCIMQNFRCIILSAIASAAADTARQCIWQNDSDSFIKFINKLRAVINIGKIDNDARLSNFKIYPLSVISEIFVMSSNIPG